jgi:peptide/nickel transport system permease protein
MTSLAPARDLLRRVVASPMGVIGTALLALVLVAAFLGPHAVSADPLRQVLRPDRIFLPPAPDALFGTDNLGRDVLARVLAGMRLSLALAVVAVAIGLASGAALGAFAGLVGGIADRIIVRAMDALMAFPVLILAIAVAVAFGRGPQGIVVAVAFVNIPIFARLARSQTLRVVSMPYMTAAEILGCSLWRRLWRHLAPNLFNPLIVQGTVSLSFAVLIEAGLSFLGLGIQAPRPALGLMIAEAKAFIGIAPHLVLFPSLGIVAIVVALNLVGDAFAEATDPRRART